MLYIFLPYLFYNIIKLYFLEKEFIQKNYRLEMYLLKIVYNRWRNKTRRYKHKL